MALAASEWTQIPFEWFFFPYWQVGGTIPTGSDYMFVYLQA